MSSLAASQTEAFLGTQIRQDGAGPMLVSHRLQLLVIAGPDSGKQGSVVGRQFRIGTASDNELMLSDSTISRHHCEICVRGDRYLLRDLASTNGTTLNGIPVVEAYLTPGGRIGMGDSELLFEPQKQWQRLELGTVNSDHFGELYGSSSCMGPVFALLRKVADTDLSCLLHGETGTGKELAARAVHLHSNRAQQPFVVVDCGAISPNLMESELFGHERGAFTSADRQRIGAFETAHGGVVFLDEIGELPLHLQPKLLRVLERQEVKRVGASKELTVDVRIIAATHRDLLAMVGEGRFREDLYYRLAEVVVSLPPLRERQSDIPLIAARILEQPVVEGGSVPARPAALPRHLSPEAVVALQSRPWPGNVRELRNMLRRAAALSNATLLRPQDFTQLEASSNVPSSADAANEGQNGEGPWVAVDANVPIKQAREHWLLPLERHYLTKLLEECAGDVEIAAQKAGVHRKSLERLLRQHGLKLYDYRRGGWQ